MTDRRTGQRIEQERGYSSIKPEDRTMDRTEDRPETHGQDRS